MIIKGLLVFCASFVFDIVWTYCIKCVSAGRIWPAAITSSMMVVLGSFTTIEYVTNHAMVVFAAAGAFVGTIVTMKYMGDGEPSKD